MGQFTASEFYHESRNNWTTILNYAAGVAGAKKCDRFWFIHILSYRFNPIRSQLETVLDFWLVNVYMKECELIKGGHTFGLLAEIISVSSPNVHTPYSPTLYSCYRIIISTAQNFSGGQFSGGILLKLLGFFALLFSAVYSVLGIKLTEECVMGSNALMWSSLILSLINKLLLALGWLIS